MFFLNIHFHFEIEFLIKNEKKVYLLMLKTVQSGHFTYWIQCVDWLFPSNSTNIYLKVLVQKDL